MFEQKNVKDFWAGKKVFVTSPKSFLGGWTVLALRHLGAEVFGFSDVVANSPNLFDLCNMGQTVSTTYADPREGKNLYNALQFAQADVVLHLGEQGLLREGERTPFDIVSKAVLTTTLLMEALRETASARSIVVVSSDKVYERSRQNFAATEDTKVVAQEIFPTSKLCAELIALSYRKTFFQPDKYNRHKIALATARLEAGIGGGDFSESSLIPQAVQSVLNQKPFELRNPHSLRPWIHVLDQVNGVLKLAQALFEHGPKLAPTYNLGAISTATVQEVYETFTCEWAHLANSRSANIPVPEAAESQLSVHGTMSSKLAEQDLGWAPQWSLQQSLLDSARWYHDFYNDRATSLSLERSVREYFL